MIKNTFLLLFLILLFNLSCAKDSEIKTAEFVYEGESIRLKIYDPIKYKVFKENKYDGKITYLDFLKVGKLDIWIGNFEKEESEFSRFGLWSFDGDKVQKLFTVSRGIFVKHDESIYLLAEETFDQHSKVSLLYQLTFDNNSVEYKQVFRLPGFMNNVEVGKKDLIVSGFVNTRPFAVSIDQDGLWKELLFIK